jgi:hypothetical protein
LVHGWSAFSGRRHFLPAAGPSTSRPTIDRSNRSESETRASERRSPPSL